MMNGTYGSAMDGLTETSPAASPSCASTRRTVEWWWPTCVAIVPTGHFSA